MKALSKGFWLFPFCPINKCRSVHLMAIYMMILRPYFNKPIPSGNFQQIRFKEPNVHLSNFFLFYFSFIFTDKQTLISPKFYMFVSIVLQICRQCLIRKKPAHVIMSIIFSFKNVYSATRNKTKRMRENS